MKPDELRYLAGALTAIADDDGDGAASHDMRKAAAYLRQQAEATDVAGLWPIAKLTVAEDGSVTASLYCPGLPPGVHEVWPCPVFAKPGVEYVPAPPFDPAHEPPWHRSDLGPAQGQTDETAIDGAFDALAEAGRKTVRYPIAAPAPPAARDDEIWSGHYELGPTRVLAPQPVAGERTYTKKELIAHVNTALEVQAQPAALTDAKPTCSWSQDGEDSDMWQTGCKRYFRLDKGDPNDNRMYHCCFCGKPIDCEPFITEDEPDDAVLAAQAGKAK